MGIEFFKYHALGNDYIVIDPNRSKINLTKATIHRICHRNFGVGSDGILYGPIMEDNGIGLRIYNPDGSEAEKSGNGIRIFSKYLVDAGYVDDRTFHVKTLGGEVTIELLDEKGHLIKVDMGTITFQSAQIPVLGSAREVVNEVLELGGEPFLVTCVSIGNPHCVIPLENISEEMAKRLGPHVENHPQFPNRINMQLLQVMDRNNIRIEIWERGAGYTLASGSSSCAAASAAYRLGLVEPQLKVHMPGGCMDIDIRPDEHIFMTGSVSSIASGMMTEEFLLSLDKR